MARILTLIILILGVLTSVIAGASAPTFCKCTCFSNYTIIPLGPQHDADNPQQQLPSSLKPLRRSPLSYHSGDNGESDSDDLNRAPREDTQKQTHSLLDSFSQEDDIELMRLLNEQLSDRRGGASKPAPRRQSLEEPSQPRERCPPSPMEYGESKRSIPSFWTPLALLPRMPGFTQEKRAASSSCAQCNRAFCMSYNLPICKDAEEKDILTMCFQRDSRKDRIIVWAFILATGGLLGYAGVKRFLKMRENRRGIGVRPDETSRGAYRPVIGDGTQGESDH